MHEHVCINIQTIVHSKNATPPPSQKKPQKNNNKIPETQKAYTFIK